VVERTRCGALGALVASGLVLLAACGGGGGGTKAVKTATGGAITVEARDISFDVGTIDASPGPLAVTLVNRGAMFHTFKVEGTSFELKADAGKTETGTVTLAKGTYTFECTVPGHASAGMKGKIVVS
jgi:plastocyanin